MKIISEAGASPVHGRGSGDRTPEMNGALSFASVNLSNCQFCSSFICDVSKCQISQIVITAIGCRQWAEEKYGCSGLLICIIFISCPKDNKLYTKWVVVARSLAGIKTCKNYLSLHKTHHFVTKT